MLATCVCVGSVKSNLKGTCFIHKLERTSDTPVLCIVLAQRLLTYLCEPWNIIAMFGRGISDQMLLLST